MSIPEPKVVVLEESEPKKDDVEKATEEKSEEPKEEKAEPSEKTDDAPDAAVESTSKKEKVRNIVVLF